MIACVMADPIEDVARWFQGKTEAMEAALVPLVHINSFTENVEGGRTVGERLRDDLFKIPGLSAEVVPSERFADHLIFRSHGKDDKEPVVLVGHLDTVFPPGTFEGYTRDGDVARGPGVLDMKGGLVVMAYAIRAIAETVGLGAVPPLRVVVVSDEEVGSPEGQGIITRASARAGAALVFEAGRKADAIITRRKGTGAMKAVAHGRAAHAGANHKDGANAIWALARFVDLAQRKTDYGRGITVNVGRVSGGESKNTVPDRAEANLDIRFETKGDAEWLIAALGEAAQEAAAGVPGTRIELTGGASRLPLERTEASGALLVEYGACAAAVGLGASEASLIGGGSDASTTSAMGIPSIDGLGPRGSGFHTKDELSELSTFVPKAEAVARFLIGRGR